VIDANGGNVNLQSADIHGGTLKTPSGLIQALDRGSLLDGSTSAINNQGTGDTTNNNYLAIDGTINNTGSIQAEAM
jgi:hypothetical protein